MKAAIIGNGVSRKDIDLESLCKVVDSTYGCNALVRDFEPDYLIAIDDKILEEIRASDFPENKLIEIPFDKQFEPAEFNPSRPRENAGMLAMREAIKAGHDSLICIGFDFLLDDAPANLGNIYNGTFGYGPETRANVNDCYNRTRYLEWFCNQNTDVRFGFYFPFEYTQKQFRHVNSTNVFLAFLGD